MYEIEVKRDGRVDMFMGQWTSHTKRLVKRKLKQID